MVEQATFGQAGLESGMFAASLLETSWDHRSRRSWTTLTSFGLLSIVIGLLLLIPILTTVGLPAARTTVTTPISMGRPDPGPAPQPHGARSTGVQVIPFSGPIVAPGRMPPRILPGDGEVLQAPNVGDTIGSGPFVSGPGIPFPTIGTRPIPIPAPPTIVRQFRTSSMLQGSLSHRVEPVYPPLARSARIQGPVILAAVISTSGVIQNLRLISGHPMLVPAAISAVSQWRYKPYILNGEAIEVETQITVNFVLGGS